MTSLFQEVGRSKNLKMDPEWVLNFELATDNLNIPEYAIIT